jgi:hypothetical protein
MCEMSKSKSLPILASAALLASSVVAQAALITLTASGTDADNEPLAASALFTTSAGHIQVVLTNTLAPSQIRSAGQALSDISFTLSNTPGTPGTLTASGQLGNLGAGGVVTDTSGSPVRFIGQGPPPPGGTGTFTVNNATNTILMEALGGGQPSQMILPSAAAFPNANASLFNFNPSTIGAGTFELNFTGSGITAATTVSVATFSFGTGPDTFITVPAPLIGHGLLALLAIGGVLFGGKLLENLKKRSLQTA